MLPLTELSRRAELFGLDQYVAALTRRRFGTAEHHGQGVLDSAFWWPDSFRDQNADLIKSWSKVTLPGKLAVCATYYNPCGYRRRLENFQRFYVAAKSQGADLWVMEASHERFPFELPQDIPQLRRVVSHSILWHKERLINVLLRRLPADYDKVAWVDCDLLWDNTEWVAQTCDLLETYPAVQMFSHVTWLSPHGEPDYWWGGDSVDHPGVACAVAHDGDQELGKTVPGGAWAARREWLQSVGLWDYHIVGGGDNVCSHALYGRDPAWCSFGKLAASMTAWAARVYPYVLGEVGYVPGRVRHLWHGDRDKRQYWGRFQRAGMSEFNPLEHLKVAERGGGCYEWTPSAPGELVESVRGYFHERQEDGQ